MDYKKIVDDARESAVICHGAGLNNLSGRILCYADAIEQLLETVEAMKNPHIKVQIDCEELSISELCNRLERFKKERDAALKKIEVLTKEKEFWKEDALSVSVSELMMSYDALSREWAKEKNRADKLESRVKELELNRPVQVDGDVFELAVKLAKVTAERDKAVEMVHNLVNEFGICTGCKRLNKECSEVYICECDGKDHWEWEGLDE